MGGLAPGWRLVRSPGGRDARSVRQCGYGNVLGVECQAGETVVRFAAGNQGPGVLNGLRDIEERSIDALPAGPLHRGLRGDLEPDGQRVGGHPLHVAGLGGPAAPRRENGPVSAEQAARHPRLDGPEPGFACPGEDVRDVLPGLAPDLLVEVDEPPAEQPRQFATDGRLAAGHEADQEDPGRRGWGTPAAGRVIHDAGGGRAGRRCSPRSSGASRRGCRPRTSR